MTVYIREADIPDEFDGIQVRLYSNEMTYLATGELYCVVYPHGTFWRVDSDEKGINPVYPGDWIEPL